LTESSVNGNKIPHFNANQRYQVQWIDNLHYGFEVSQFRRRLLVLVAKIGDSVYPEGSQDVFNRHT